MMKNKKILLILSVVAIVAAVAVSLVACATPVDFNEAFDKMIKAVDNTVNLETYYLRINIQETGGSTETIKLNVKKDSANYISEKKKDSFSDPVRNVWYGNNKYYYTPVTEGDVTKYHAYHSTSINDMFANNGLTAFKVDNVFKLVSQLNKDNISEKWEVAGKKGEMETKTASATMTGVTTKLIFKVNAADKNIIPYEGDIFDLSGKEVTVEVITIENVSRIANLTYVVPGVNGAKDRTVTIAVNAAGPKLELIGENNSDIVWKN